MSELILSVYLSFQFGLPNSFFSFLMRVVIQKVLSASVSVEGRLVSKIGRGLMCLVGIRDDDDKACSEVIAKKILV